MSSRAYPYIAGCYAAWSPTLQRAYERRFPDSDRCIVKIGKSYDVLCRIENFWGVQNRLSRKEKFVVDPKGKFHTRDWYLAYFVAEKAEKKRKALETRLHKSFLTLGDRIWTYLHSQICEDSYSPYPAELFSARKPILASQFPDLGTIYSQIPRTFLSGLPPEGRMITQHVAKSDLAIEGTEGRLCSSLIPQSHSLQVSLPA